MIWDHDHEQARDMMDFKYNEYFLQVTIVSLIVTIVSNPSAEILKKLDNYFMNVEDPLLVSNSYIFECLSI